MARGQPHWTTSPGLKIGGPQGRGGSSPSSGTRLRQLPRRRREVARRASAALTLTLALVWPAHDAADATVANVVGPDRLAGPAAVDALGSRRLGRRRPLVLVR